MTLPKVQHDSETPAQGQQVITAVALIFKFIDGEPAVFLPRRAQTKKFLPDVYELPGGHIDFGEDIETGLKREIVEEFGVEVQLGEPFAAFTYMNDIKGSHSIEVVYFGQFTNPEEQIRLQPEDHSEYVWAKISDLPQIYIGDKGMDNIEVQKILRGLQLLKTKSNPFIPATK